MWPPCCMSSRGLCSLPGRGCPTMLTRVDVQPEVVEGCLGAAFPTCSMEISASQHCPKLDTLDCNLCFFDCVPQEWK